MNAVDAMLPKSPVRADHGKAVQAADDNAPRGDADGGAAPRFEEILAGADGRGTDGARRAHERQGRARGEADADASEAREPKAKGTPRDTVTDADTGTAARNDTAQPVGLAAIQASLAAAGAALLRQTGGRTGAESDDASGAEGGGARGVALQAGADGEETPAQAIRFTLVSRETHFAPTLRAMGGPQTRKPDGDDAATTGSPAGRPGAASQSGAAQQPGAAAQAALASPTSAAEAAVAAQPKPAIEIKGVAPKADADATADETSKPSETTKDSADPRTTLPRGMAAAGQDVAGKAGTGRREAGHGDMARGDAGRAEAGRAATAGPRSAGVDATEPPQPASGGLPPGQLGRIASAIASQSAPAQSSGAPQTGGGQALPGPVRTLVLQLHPVDLGTVQIDMRMVDGELTVTLGAARGDTARMLEADKKALTDLLKAEGKDAGSVTVHAVHTDRVAPTPDAQSAAMRNGAGQAWADGQASGGQGASGSAGDQGRSPAGNGQARAGQGNHHSEGRDGNANAPRDGSGGRGLYV